MAVPDTNTFTLQNVVDEVVPTTNDLVDCFADATASLFDPNYSGSKNALYNFRNYGGDVVPYINDFDWNTNTTSPITLSLTIESDDTMAVVMFSTNYNVGLGTITVTDSVSGTWTHFNTSDGNTSVYYCNTLGTTGARTITITASTATVMAAIGFTLKRSATTLSGSVSKTLDEDLSANTISHSFTPTDVKSLIISAATTYTTKGLITWSSFGSGQNNFENAGLSGPFAIQMSSTYENTGATSADTQSATNTNVNDDKYLVSFEILPESAVDTTPPSAPTGLVATNRCQTSFTLSWTASTDDVAVTGYKIYKNGGLYVDAGDVLTFGITGQTAAATNTWTVKAYDAAANESTASTGLNVTQGITVYSILTSTGTTTGALACASTINITRYKTTSGGVSAGDIFYTACGVDRFNGSGSFYSDGTVSFTISATGTISLPTLCF